MAGSINKVILIGNLGADPETRSTQDGRSIVSFTLATGESWRDKMTGERREKTEWHRVVVFNENIARIASQYLRKGAKIYIEGQLQTRKWQDKEGRDRYTTEVVLQNYTGNMTFLDSASAGYPQSRGENKAGGYDKGYDKNEGYTRKDTDSFSKSSDEIDPDDDIPF